MSFSLSYRPLFSIAVREDGSGRPLTAFAFTPTETCEGRLADHGLVFRPRDSGCHVYYSLNPAAAQPLRGAIGARTSFAFLMRLAESDFFQRYEPALSAQTGPQLYFDNLTASGNIQAKSTLTVGTTAQAPDAARLYARNFVAATDVGGPGAPTRLLVKDKFGAGATVRDVPIAKSPGQKRALTRIDLEEAEPGVYSLATDAAGTPPRTIYVDDQVARSGAAAIAEIHWETPQDAAPAGGVAYVIRFRRK